MTLDEIKACTRPDGDCWLWTGPDNGAGYGRIRFKGELVYVHRLIYEDACGPIPAGLHIDHLCRQPSCINPDHLEAVTPRENGRRGIKGVLTTHCPQGHEYTEENTYRKANGRRECRICRRVNFKKWAAVHRPPGTPR
jgi:hypothetical protein